MFASILWLASACSVPSHTVCNLPISLLLFTGETEIAMRAALRPQGTLNYCGSTGSAGSAGFPPSLEERERYTIAEVTSLCTGFLTHYVVTFLLSPASKTNRSSHQLPDLSSAYIWMFHPPPVFPVDWLPPLMMSGDVSLSASLLRRPA